MNYNILSDDQIHFMIKQKSEQERNATMEIIELLMHVRDRRIHLKRGYSSLFKYCVKELKYSDGAAFRRIKAMKLVEELPQVIEAIESGALNLTSASQLQSAFEVKAKRKEALADSEKLELIEKSLGQSTRPVEKVIAEVIPEAISYKESIKPVGSNLIKIEILVTEEEFQEIQKLKDLRSHKNHKVSDMFKDLVQEDLRRKDPEVKKQRTDSATNKQSKSDPNQGRKSASAPNHTSTSAPTPQTAKKKSSRYIPSPVKHEVWLRDKGQCTYVDPITKRKCETKYRLQYEHCDPHAMGGANTADNIRLLCQSHNNLMAIHQFGQSKMDEYFKN